MSTKPKPNEALFLELLKKYLNTGESNIHEDTTVEMLEKVATGGDDKGLSKKLNSTYYEYLTKIVKENDVPKIGECEQNPKGCGIGTSEAEQTRCHCEELVQAATRTVSKVTRAEKLIKIKKYRRIISKQFSK